MADKVPKAAAPKAKVAAAPAKGSVSAEVQEVKGGKATGVREEMIEREEIGGFGIWLRESIRQAPSWLVSGVVHMIVLLALALTFIKMHDDDVRQLVVTPGDSEEIDDMEDLEDEMDELDEAIDIPDTPTDVTMPVAAVEEMAAPAFNEAPDVTGFEPSAPVNLTAARGVMSGKGLEGRYNRSRLVRQGGGTPGSEKAVAAALRWFQAHQLPDGGWSFDHTLAPYCRGKCSVPGNMAEARNAATALALLPFLGAGHTHMKGKYKSEVARGLMFLKNRMKLSPKGGSLMESGGRMYSHGLASIALCEAYGMTHDRALEGAAQQSLNFICHAQHKTNGGWRYAPGDAGDTSVVGWQLMALKSGNMAYLKIPPVVVERAKAYLDLVQSESGAKYGYTNSGGGKATSAIGLLCRMYLGWKKDQPGLQRGCEIISKQGPSFKGKGKSISANMYYNYYATQVMRHQEGEMWTKWNDVMRDSLVNSQTGPGSHEEGSWAFKGGDHGTGSGGRLYSTSMATMILEVYYRHLPIYRKQSTEDDFPD
jgi:hypothetical protein